jgi:hypothetical protein
VVVQVGMNERTKKTPCKPENVLGNVFIEIKTKSIPATDKPKEQHKRASQHRISKFKMIIHLDRFIFYTNQIHVQSNLMLFCHIVEFVNIN